MIDQSDTLLLTGIIITAGLLARQILSLRSTLAQRDSENAALLKAYRCVAAERDEEREAHLLTRERYDEQRAELTVYRAEERERRGDVWGAN